MYPYNSSEQQINGCLKVNGYIGNTDECIGYVSQQAFIVNDTVRANILWGNKYDEEYYNKCLIAALLKHDLSILANGDLTEIGGAIKHHRRIIQTIKTIQSIQMQSIKTIQIKSFQIQLIQIQLIQIQLIQIIIEINNKIHQIDSNPIDQMQQMVMKRRYNITSTTKYCQ